MARWQVWKQASDVVWETVAREINVATGLSGADFAVLSRVVERGAGSLRQHELATMLGWQPSRLSRQIARMEGRGLVSRMVDGTDLRDLDLEAWRRQVTMVFQDFVRFELTLRENVAPRETAGDDAGISLDETINAALGEAGATGLAGLDTVLAKGYTGGTDLSGGQWQRVALARALAAVRLGAGLVLLDEPTAQLDVRGETEIFERILAATRLCTTILISHRFNTVRHVDRIAVVDDGRVVELGSHDELMALRGRYWRMFSLQAERFAAGAPEEGEEEVTFDVLS